MIAVAQKIFSDEIFKLIKELTKAVLSDRTSSFCLQGTTHRGKSTT
jgi:hypothetical protein